MRGQEVGARALARPIDDVAAMRVGARGESARGRGGGVVGVDADAAQVPAEARLEERARWLGQGLAAAEGANPHVELGRDVGHLAGAHLRRDRHVLVVLGLTSQVVAALCGRRGRGGRPERGAIGRRRAHHLIGHPVGLALEAVARPSHLELRLDQSPDRPVADAVLQRDQRRARGRRRGLAIRRGHRTRPSRLLRLGSLAKPDRVAHHWSEGLRGPQDLRGLCRMGRR